MKICYGNVLRLLLRDLKFSFKKNIFKTLFFTIFFLIIIFLNASKLNSINVTDANKLFLEVFKGVPPVEQNSGFELPVLWIMINAFIIFITGDYVKYDIDKNGKYIFVRIKNKTEFWLSKVLWTIITVIFLNILLLTIFLLLSKWPYKFVFGSYIDSVQISYKKIFLYSFILYTTTLSVLCVMQIVVSLALNSVYAYLSILALILLSIFVDKNFLPAQHSLLLRHYPFTLSKKLTVFNSLIYNIVFLIILVFIGDYIIKKKDIF